VAEQTTVLDRNGNGRRDHFLPQEILVSDLLQRIRENMPRMFVSNPTMLSMKRFSSRWA